jgi:hypothetical protein
MSACQKHPTFNIENGVYYRAADPTVKKDWLPKNASKGAIYYKIAQNENMDEIAALMGEAQLIHSQEGSDDSGFVSVARCPLCLAQSTDPIVKSILKQRGYLCVLLINPKNQPGAPYVFHMEGPGIVKIWQKSRSSRDTIQCHISTLSLKSCKGAIGV